MVIIFFFVSDQNNEQNETKTFTNISRKHNLIEVQGIEIAYILFVTHYCYTKSVWFHFCPIFFSVSLQPEENSIKAIQIDLNNFKEFNQLFVMNILIIFDEI